MVKREGVVPSLVTMFLHDRGRCFQFVKLGVEHGRYLVHWYAYGVGKGLLQTHGDANPSLFLLLNVTLYLRLGSSYSYFQDVASWLQSAGMKNMICAHTNVMPYTPTMTFILLWKCPLKWGRREGTCLFT